MRFYNIIWCIPENGGFLKTRIAFCVHAKSSKITNFEYTRMGFLVETLLLGRRIVSWHKQSNFYHHKRTACELYIFPFSTYICKNVQNVSKYDIMGDSWKHILWMTQFVKSFQIYSKSGKLGMGVWLLQKYFMLFFTSGAHITLLLRFM